MTQSPKDEVKFQERDRHINKDDIKNDIKQYK